MSTPSTATLEEVIRQAGEGWILDWFSPKEEALNHLRETLVAVSQRAKSRLGDNAPDFSESAIIAEYSRNPQKVRGFFQALGGTRTPDMLLLVWRIIQGMEVKSLNVAYERKQSFHARVILESPYGEQDDPYESDSIRDFSLLRHIGIFEIDNRPVFDGFYALKLGQR